VSQPASSRPFNRSNTRTNAPRSAGGSHQPNPTRGSAPRSGGPRSSAPRSSAPRSGAPRSGGQHSGGQRSGASRAQTSRPSVASSLAWNEIPLESIDPASIPSFEELGLPKGLADALARSGVTAPFPIQAAVIADVVAGKDVLGRAATGSGKTLAFGLPLIVRLEGNRAAPRHPRGLVLVPTRELAMQVTDAIAPLAQARGLSTHLVAGGLAIGKQISSLARGVDILVCTPGRLEDLIQRRACDLSQVEVSVLDEADHMADLGFMPAVRRILDATPSTGQRLLFSATLDGDVSKLISLYLVNPAAHAVASATAQIVTMDHHVFRVNHDDKIDVAAHIGAREGRTIMFVRTKHGADRLAKQLGRVGVAAGALHGGRSQSQRTRALDAFKDGSVPVLVATDVAARGIHVDDVSLVLHVDPPAESKDYLHRSGRTARAGATGTVVMLATPDQQGPVRRILSDAAVTAATRSVSIGDPILGELTGGRVPSGIPVREAVRAVAPVRQRSGGHRSTTPRSGGQRSSAPRAQRTASGQRSTGGTVYSSRTGDAAGSGTLSEGRGAARHPQHAERRPRRASAPTRTI
jgi:superfamily II DNA/RNA helicase